MYGILKSVTNTGLISELSSVFTAPLSITSNHPGYAQDTLSLKRRTSSGSAQRWEIEAGIAPTDSITNISVNEIQSDAPNLFIHSIRNRTSDTIFIRMPQIYKRTRAGISISTPTGNFENTFPRMHAYDDALAGTNLISMKADPPYLEGYRWTPAIGEFISFSTNAVNQSTPSGDTKVYVIIDPGTIHIEGSYQWAENIEIYPALLKPVINGTIINYGKNVTMRAKYDTDNHFGIRYQDGILVDNGTYKFVEAL